MKSGEVVRLLDFVLHSHSMIQLRSVNENVRIILHLPMLTMTHSLYVDTAKIGEVHMVQDFAGQVKNYTATALLQTLQCSLRLVGTWDDGDVVLRL